MLNSAETYPPGLIMPPPRAVGWACKAMCFITAWACKAMCFTWNLTAWACFVLICWVFPGFVLFLGPSQKPKIKKPRENPTNQNNTKTKPKKPKQHQNKTKTTPKQTRENHTNKTKVSSGQLGALGPLGSLLFFCFLVFPAFVCCLVWFCFVWYSLVC